MSFGSQNLLLSQEDGETRAWMWNLEEPGLKIFCIPDSSHGAKKAINNLESAWVGACEKRRLLLPELLVTSILTSIPPLEPQDGHRGQSLPRGDGPGEDTCGEEAYLFLMRRIYDLMNSYEPYYRGELQHEPRLIELRWCQKWLRAWRKFNEIVDVGHVVSQTERAKWGLSHQLWFDLDLMIEGFIGLINSMVAEFGAGNVAVRGRAMNQDTLESMFSSLRYLCGGGSDPSAYQVMQCVDPAEQQRREKQQAVASRKRKANSGVNDDEVPVRRGWEDTACYDDEPPEPDEPDGEEPHLMKWALREPPDFDERFQQLLQPGAPASLLRESFEVSWKRLRKVQEWDATTNGELRMMPWLSSKHFNRDNYDKMNVGMALNIMSVDTVRMLCFLRTVFNKERQSNSIVY